MGMFDEIVCEMPLPGEAPTKCLQTKDLGRELDTYLITEDGMLIRTQYVDYTGTITAYSYVGDQWSEYTITVKDGQVQSIDLLEEKEDNNAEDPSRDPA